MLGYRITETYFKSLSELILPHSLPHGPILHPVVCKTKKLKAPHLRDFR